VATAAEDERQRLITEREQQRSKEIDPTVAHFLSLIENQSGPAPVVQIADAPAPTLRSKIQKQRTEKAASDKGMSPPAVELDPEAITGERRAKMVGNFPVAEGGAPIADRFLAGIKKTDLGKYNYLVSRFGEKNVEEVLGNDGETVVGFKWRSGPDQSWRMFDPTPDAMRHGGGIKGQLKAYAADLPGDIADVAGPALLEGGPGAVTSMAGAAVGGIPGAVLGGIPGDAAGAVARDVVAESIPGKEDDTKRATWRDMFANAAAGGVSNAIPLVGRYAVTPTRSIARRVAKESVFDPLKDAAIREATDDAASAATRGAAEDIASASARRATTDIIPERAALGERTGVDLSAGQLSGSRRMLQKEDALSSVEKYADQIGDAQMKRVRQGELHLRRTLDAAGGGQRADALDAGTGTVAAYTNYTKQLDEARAAATRPKFAEADVLPGGQALPLDNFLTKIQERIAKEPRGSTSGTRAIYSDLKRIAKEFADKPTATASELSSLLSDWGKAARGESLEAFKEADPRRARAMAADLFGALRKDLDAAAESGTPAAAKLLEARNTFRDLSKPIEEAKSTLLQSFVKLDEKGAGDTIGSTLMQTRSPNQIRQAMEIVQKADPSGEAGRKLFSDALGSLVEKAPAGTADANQAGVGTSLARFASVGRANRKKVLALVAGMGDSAEAKQVLEMWNDAIRVSEIITDRGLPPGSPTASRLFNATDEGASVIKDAKSGGIGGAVAGVAERVLTKTPRLNGQALADIASDPEKRDAFLGLVQQMKSAGGRMKAEATSGRAHAEAWFRAAVQTGIIETRDAAQGRANVADIEAERGRARFTPGGAIAGAQP
jgi:hypothetical protein